MVNLSFEDQEVLTPDAPMFDFYKEAGKREYLFVDQMKAKWQLKNRALAVVLIIVMTATFAFYNAYVGSRSQIVLITTTEKMSNFLVWNPNCQIPRIEILDEETRPLFHTRRYKTCSQKEPLTYVVKENNTATLYIDPHMVSSYDKKGVTCCVKYIHRDASSKKPDFQIQYSNCKYFTNKIVLESEFVLVNCNGLKSKKKVYENAHSVVLIKPEVEAQFGKYKELRGIDPEAKEQPPHISVLMIGIDSMSRMQLHRSLPKTADYLQNNGWIELEGYNKIGDNTFPNLCAVLLGMEYERVYKECNPDKVGGLDKCGFIWRKFHDYGYVTAYAEDSGYINTFNYLRKGFKEAPTDYYLRPYVVAAEKQLHIVDEYGIHFCVGPVQSSERILDYAKDFSSTFKDRPNFGLFWMSSFSHNDFSEPSMMDEKFLSFIGDLQSNNITENSIVVFFSDHGIRFGDILKTTSGWYEERLPMFNIWLPLWYRQKYPEKYYNLLNNTRRLTTPYDLYMTLQDVLATEMPVDEVQTVTSQGCPECKSMFLNIPDNRTCGEAGINQHFCTCYGYRKIHYINDTLKTVGPFVVNVINDLIKYSKFPNETKHCAVLKLSYIKQISISQNAISNEKQRSWYLLVMFNTRPGNALFEATVIMRYEGNSTKPSFEQIGPISRLDKYGSQSRCVNNVNLKKYCYCR